MEIKYFILCVINLHISNFAYSDANSSKCGTIDDNIVGDLRAQVPWMAVIFRKNAEDCTWAFWKTGSIIGPSTIIMSGRHFWNISTSIDNTVTNHGMFPFRPSDFLVGVGLLSDDFREADFYSHYFKVEYITPHVHSDQKYSSFDMALVHLKTAIKFTRYVRPLCIADKSYTAPVSDFASIATSLSLKAGFGSDGGFQKLYKNPVVLDNYPYDSNCSIELKRKTNLAQIEHGDLPIKRCVDLDAGLAVYQLGGWYLTSVSVGGLDPSPLAKAMEEWYFFSPLDKKLFSWVQNSMLCGPGNNTCYQEKCQKNCKPQENCVPSEDPIDNWCTNCKESGMLESDNDTPVNETPNSTTLLPSPVATVTATTPSSASSTTEIKNGSGGSPETKLIETMQSIPTNTGRPEMTISKPHTSDEDEIKNITADNFCSPVSETESVSVKCYVEVDSVKYTVNCSTAIVAGTVAKLSCKKYFKSTSGNPILFKKCKENNEWTNKEKTFACSVDCGLSDEDFTPLMVHGEETKNSRWPWVVNLYRKVEDSFTYICGGTLINRNSVITAAHCVVDQHGHTVNENLFRVVISPISPDLPDHYINVTSQVMKVDFVAIHGEFNWETANTDIALLKLSSTVNINKDSRPVCFPFKNSDDGELSNVQLQPGSFGYISGFGMDETLKLTRNLHQLKLPVVRKNDCEKLLVRQLTDHQFCAGFTNGSSPCNGDSGNGLMFLSPAPPYRYYIQGIVSSGKHQKDSNLCDNRKYTVFTKVVDFSDWVSKTLSLFDGS